MQGLDAVQEGERIMTICNACRYCEGFCAVFPAMERRLRFVEADMNYLANLCHNCSECLQSCQYAEPHPFAVNVPRTLAQIRVHSWRKYSWPGPLASALRSYGVPGVLVLAAVMAAIMAVAARAFGQDAPATAARADFYAVVPHAVLATSFGAVFVLVVAALAIGVARFARDTRGGAEEAAARGAATGLRHAFTLKYLHGSGEDCPSTESVRGPWRRWFHHLTFYGFLLCFASTSVAAVYHSVLALRAPYPLASLPVLLGIFGGIGLFIGPLGLWALRGRRDPATLDPRQAGPDRGFLLLLVLTSTTGLALLVWRDTAAMRVLLIVHLAVVLALFVTLPYGRFVHGLYRTAALIKSARESTLDSATGSME